MRTPSRFVATVSLALTISGGMLTSALAAPPKPKPGPAFEAPGGVIINSTTQGATVEIDGKVMGTVPMEDSIVLLAGEHTLKVHMRGYLQHVDTFTVTAGEEIELEIDLIPFAGIVRVNTAEPGATVRVDGKIEGVTPFDKDIAVGKKQLLVARPGFYDETRDLDVRAGETYNIDIQMRPLPEKPGESAAFYETWWFWTIVGVAGAGTATAIALSTGGEAAPPSPSFSLSIP